MRVCEMVAHFRLPCVVAMAACLICIHLPYANALPDSKVPSHAIRINKRDTTLGSGRIGTGGVEMHCKLHRRNCMDGGMHYNKREPLFQNLPQLLAQRFRFQEPVVVPEVEMDLSQEFDGGSELKRSRELDVSPYEQRRQSVQSLMDLFRAAQTIVDKRRSW